MWNINVSLKALKICRIQLSKQCRKDSLCTSLGRLRFNFDQVLGFGGQVYSKERFVSVFGMSTVCSYLQCMYMLQTSAEIGYCSPEWWQQQLTA